MNYQTLIVIIIILMLFIIVILLIAGWLASQCKVLAEELDKKEESNKLVMPVAEIKAQFSEEDMKKIKELLNNAKPGSVKLGEPEEEKKVMCDHLYSSIVLIDDPINCREKLVFHCEHCCHEEIMPIERGLMTKFFMGGGTT